MATPKYETPPTAVAGYPLAAADWNAKVRDSLESLAKPPRAGIHRTTDQLVGNGAVSTIVWNTADYDTDGFWNPGTPDRLTIPANLGGVYLVTASPIFDINATGARYSTVSKNGIGYGSPQNSGGFSGWYVQHCVSQIMPLAPGDYVGAAVYQSSGISLNLKGTVYKMTLAICRLGAA
jgi:hypothetical protein